MLELGMNPLCVTATTDKLSDIGRRNIENLKALGVDFVEVHDQPGRAAPHQQARALPGRRHLVARARHDLHDAGAPRGADGHQADRVGREPAERVRRPGRGGHRQHARRGAGSRSSAGCSGLRVSDLVGQDGIEPKHLVQYTYPTDDDLARVGVTGIFLGYYMPWDGLQNAIFAQAYGFETWPGTIEGSLVQLREPRQPPDRHPRLLQVPQVRLRPRDRHRVDARPPRPPAPRRRARAGEAPRRPVPVDLPRQADRGDARATST